MDIIDYQDRVIELFSSGNATKAQWREMARAVLDASESECGRTESIDATIDPDYQKGLES